MAHAKPVVTDGEGTSLTLLGEGDVDARLKGETLELLIGKGEILELVQSI